MTGSTRRTFLKVATAAGLGLYGIGEPLKGQNYSDDSLGKAYGFFDAPDATYESIEKELPAIRKAVLTPHELKLALRDGDASEVSDPAQATGHFRYALEASYLGHSNEEAARELAHIFNQAVHTPLYSEDWKTGFRGRVAYREAGHWKHIDEDETFSDSEELS